MRRLTGLRPAFLAGVVLLWTLFTFLPALHNDFVNWDDFRMFLDNEDHKGPWEGRFWAAWTSHRIGEYMPVTWMTYAIDRALWQDQAQDARCRRLDAGTRPSRTGGGGADYCRGALRQEALARHSDRVARLPDPDRAVVRHPSVRPAARRGRPLHLCGVHRIRHRCRRNRDRGVAGVPDRSAATIARGGPRDGDRAGPAHLERVDLVPDARVAQWHHPLGLGHPRHSRLARHPEQPRLGVGAGRGARSGRGLPAPRDRHVAEQPRRAPDAGPDPRG